MAYRLENGEAISDAFRRSGREQLDKAIEELTEGMRKDPVDAIHSARKALKKERSLLRLGRGAIAKGRRRDEADRFRDAAQRLGGSRDSDVVIQALDDLHERYAGQVPVDTFEAVRELLTAERDVARTRLIKSAAIGDVVEELKSARQRIDDWPPHANGWSAISKGLARSYRRGRKAFRTARAAQTDDNLHDWRKRAKDLWYHLRLLRPIAPHTLRGQADEAHRLSDLLGDDHDLSVLHGAVLRIAPDVLADIDPVIGLIEHRRDQLQAEAMYLGERLYAERPKAFRRRLKRYWKAWRAETKAIESRRPVELADAAR